MQVAAIHYVNRTSFRDEFIKDVYFMNSSLSYGYKRRDAPLQV